MKTFRQFIEAWNPSEKPYRVLITKKSGAYGHYGWNASSHTFKTEDEARAFAATTKEKTTIHRAKNPDTWTKNGRWEKI